MRDTSSQEKGKGKEKRNTTIFLYCIIKSCMIQNQKEEEMKKCARYMNNQNPSTLVLRPVDDDDLRDSCRSSSSKAISEEHARGIDRGKVVIGLVGDE